MYIYTHIHISLCFHQGCNDNDAHSAMMVFATPSMARKPNPFHQLGLHFLHSSTCHERLLYYWIYKTQTVSGLRFSGRAERADPIVTPICKNQRLVFLATNDNGPVSVDKPCQGAPLGA